MREPRPLMPVAALLCEERLDGGEITRLVVQKRNRDRINVHINGQYAFALAKSVAGTLAIGQQLNQAQIEELQKRGLQSEARKRAMRLLARRPRSEAEVRANFNRNRIPEPIQDQVIADLKQSEFIDDRAFAQSWIENRTEFRPRGAAALRSELRGKGVERRTIEAALENFDEVEAAHAAAEIADSRYADRQAPERWQRAYAYLARRGFQHHSIKAAVDRLKTGAAETESEVNP